jgi:trehalose 6-phosphate synthase
VSPPFVVVSNRGPLTFDHVDGSLTAKRGAGGLVSGIGPLVAGSDALWIAAAMSDADRDAARHGIVEAEGFRVRSLAFDPADYRMAYDVVCNATLWFLYHALYDLARRPRIDTRWRQAWDAYRRVNRAFAEAVVSDAPEAAIVLVQDYHLTLLGPVLAEQRPDLRAVHFSHTPFAPPDLLRVLPGDVATELLRGMAAHRACGFHTHRWAEAFADCCRAFLGEVPDTFVAPLAPDPADIAATAGSAACGEALEQLDAELDDRLFVLRVDRIELSKNLLRGFHALDDLFERHPEWRERVVFGAFVYPSRQGLAEYLAYRQEVESLVQWLNDKWGTASWRPVLLDQSDNFERSVAAYRRYDVLLVNPVRDGLNLVAKEGLLVNERDGVLALSTEAGAWEELGHLALEINPYDVSATADVLHEALRMPAGERRAHAAALRDTVGRRTAADWLRDLLHAAEA